MEAIYREASSADLQAVYALVRLMEEDALPYEHFARVFAQKLSDDNAVMIVAQLDADVIGFGSLYVHAFLHQAGPVAQIGELVVAPEYRDDGTGSDLLEYMKSIAHERGCHIIQADVRRGIQRKAYGFFEGRGFERTHAGFTCIMEESGYYEH